MNSKLITSLVVVLLIVVVVSVAFFSHEVKADERQFASNLEGWNTVSGNWKITNDGYVGSTGGENAFIEANAHVNPSKAFTYTGDVVKSQGGGSGLAILYESSWYCIQVDTASKYITVFNICNDKNQWSFGRPMTAEEIASETQTIRIEYDGNYSFSFYNNNTLVGEKKDKNFVGGCLALKIYGKPSCFNRVYCNEAESISYSVSGIFSSNMVIQRDQPIKVWGWSDEAKDTISVSFKGETLSTTVSTDGNWQVTFSAQAYTAEPQTLRISSERSSFITEYKNILIGDVWIVSGQSNSDLPMDFTIKANPQFKSEIKESDLVRVFAQHRNDAVANKTLMVTPQKNVINPTYAWRTTTWDSVAFFSALGYHFAKALSENIDIPIGVIMAGCSGSPLFQLMSPELADSLGYKIPATDEIPAGGIYNAFFAPIIKSSFKGMLFYQGESDDSRYDVYTQQLKLYVQDLRERFNINFPFYNVQLSSHGDRILTEWPNLGKMRNSQLDALSMIPNSYLAVSIDIGWRKGDADPAHPLNKKVLGERLAGLAMANEYGISTIEKESSPIPAQLTWEKDHVLIDFKYVGDGLKLAKGTSLIGFQLKKGDKLVDTTAVIVDADTVRVEIDSNTDAVCYAMFHLAYTENANLSNSSDLPAPSFQYTVGEQVGSSSNTDIDGTAKPGTTETTKTNSLVQAILLASAVFVLGGAGIVGYVVYQKKRYLNKK